MAHTLLPVILSGGNGTRLWPLSRSSYPKQYLPLYGEGSLLQQAVLRAGRVAGASSPCIVTNNEQCFLVADQLRAIGVKPGHIVLEPAGRNTAPAAAVAALLALQESADALMLVLPSDHVIEDENRFVALMHHALDVAATGELITFGIVPTEPHTGYGYIERGRPLNGQAGVFKVDGFIEKPPLARARELFAGDRHLWNSGMFMLRAESYLEELTRLRPEIVAACRAALANAVRESDFLRLSPTHFTACPSDSIDYAVMEHTDRAAMIEARDLGWNDVGSWHALATISEADATGNCLIGDVVVEDVRDCYIRTEHRLVTAIGIEGLVIVETADAVLVSARDQTQVLKKVVERMVEAGRSEAIRHRKVHRPWGSFEGVDDGARFQVKRIIVNVGAALSLQMHYHRAEHWVVVRGTARIINGEKEILLSENQSTYIPLGVQHRLENPGRIPLELIEVQSGAYLGEDDIVRFQDSYGRN